jgi:enolase
MSTIIEVHAREILDSRGRPTVRATCDLANGARGTASVPSGASTGTAEALELRDGDPRRYGGLGCRTAVANVAGPLDDALRDRPFHGQDALDRAMIALDGTPNKARLGANAILAVSLAFARAVAAERGIPLYRHLADLLAPEEAPRTLPRPTVNLFSGGKHAGGQMPLQDVLVVPATGTIDEALATVYAVYQAAIERCRERYDLEGLTFHAGDIGALPGTERDFDVIYSRFCLHAMTPAEEDAFLAEAASRLRPGGRLLIADQLGSVDPLRSLEQDRFERMRDSSHQRLLPDADVRGFLDANDLVLLAHEVVRERIDLEERFELAETPEEERVRLRGLAPAAVYEIEVGWYVARKPGH